VAGARVKGPIGPQRAIAAALRQLRSESGKSLSDVAEDLEQMISTSKLSRLENAQGRPQRRDIRDLISYYGIEGTPLAGKLRRWVNEAQRRGWWTFVDDEVLDEGLDAHLAYEADAAVERAYTLPFVPALLQTVEYAAALFRNMEHRSEADAGKLVEVRKRRQEVLSSRDGLDPLQLVAVTHESALRQAVGPPEVLRDQLDVLLQQSGRPNVHLHVFPFSAAPVLTMTCMYAYFEYQGADSLEQDVVHIETPAGFISIDEPGQLTKYRTSHDALVRASLSEEGSRRLIRSVRDGMSIG
jgi:transcriptional regulator with XRE-family HTH domain